MDCWECVLQRTYQDKKTQLIVGFCQPGIYCLNSKGVSTCQGMQFLYSVQRAKCCGHYLEQDLNSWYRAMSSAYAKPPAFLPLYTHVATRSCMLPLVGWLTYPC